MELLTALKEKIKPRNEKDYGITLRNQTTKDLESSVLPDDFLISIWVRFTSRAQRRYTAVHVYDHPKAPPGPSYVDLLLEHLLENTGLLPPVVRFHWGPYILLSGDEQKDKDDFIRVGRVVMDIVHGEPEKEDITERSDDLCRIIHLNGYPTQRAVAGFIRDYQAQFSDVEIAEVYFHGLPKRFYRENRN